MMNFKLIYFQLLHKDPLSTMSPVAASILERAGRRGFAELIGGMRGWLAYDLPTVAAG